MAVWREGFELKEGHLCAAALGGVSHVFPNALDVEVVAVVFCH